MNPSWPLNGRTRSLPVAPSFIFECCRWTRERGSLTTSASMKSILFMSELVESHKHSPLSSLAFYAPAFLSLYFRYLHLLSLSACLICNQPDCLSGDSQTHNEPSDEAFICRKTPPTCPAEWFLGADQSPQQAPQQISPRVIFSPAELQIKRLLCYC